jgi:hypothetical protein
MYKTALPDVWFQLRDGKIDWSEHCCSPEPGELLDAADDERYALAKYVPAASRDAFAAALQRIVSEDVLPRDIANARALLAELADRQDDKP